MVEKVQCLAGVYCTGKLSQQVTQSGRETEELRQAIRVRLQSLQDAAKVKRNKTTRHAVPERKCSPEMRESLEYDAVLQL